MCANFFALAAQDSELWVRLLLARGKCNTPMTRNYTWYSTTSRRPPHCQAVSTTTNAGLVSMVCRWTRTRSKVWWLVYQRATTSRQLNKHTWPSDRQCQAIDQSPKPGSNCRRVQNRNRTRTAAEVSRSLHMKHVNNTEASNAAVHQWTDSGPKFPNLLTSDWLHIFPADYDVEYNITGFDGQ